MTWGLPKLLPGTPISPTTFKWLVTTLNMAEKVGIKLQFPAIGSGDRVM